MSPRQKALLVLGIILLGSTLILGWVFYFNIGQITISGETDFTIRFVRYNTIYCENNPCIQNIKPDHYKIIFEKKDYQLIETEITITRAQNTDLQIDFQLIPTYKTMSKKEITSFLKVPKKTPYPTEITTFKDNIIEINPKTFIYFDHIDQIIKEFKNNQIKSIMPFLKKGKLRIFAPESTDYLIISDDQTGSYLINTKTNSKQKFSTNIFTNALWNTDNKKAILIDKNLKIFLFSIKNRKLQSLDLKTKLSNIAWDSNAQLIYADTEGIHYYDCNSNKIKFLYKKEDFNPIKIKLTKNHNILYIQTDQDYKKLIFRE